MVTKLTARAPVTWTFIVHPLKSVRVATVLPFLIENHVKAVQRRVRCRRMPRCVRRGVLSFKILGRHRRDRLSNEPHLLASNAEHFFERRMCRIVESTALRVSQECTGETQRMVRVGFFRTARKSQQSVAKMR